MKRIELTKGKYALVDDEIFSYLNQWKWNYDTGYARRLSSRNDGKRFHIGMHWIVLEYFGIKVSEQVDHANLDKLDNRLSNLRPATRQQNSINRLKLSNNTSGYKGVTWHNIAKKWLAQIRINGKTKCLGLFTDKSDASKAYFITAQKYFGNFARY